MAKEMMIIFVYDTQMLQKEEDDPASAILYFHPTWVSDQQKTALCGQLMGTAHCVKSIFVAPKIVALQSGKFFVKEYGRYLMAVGTDRNIADWLLEHRATTLSSLIEFFHEDIEAMSRMYDKSSKLSAKLYQFFETYLNYVFIGGNVFSYIPSIKLPKSASNVFLEAIQILQYCQEHNYVLGGTLLYHNKVVATQLSSEVTKRIVLTDPYRIKSSAEVQIVNFDLPLGVQLLQVYITNKEYSRLHEEATRSRNIFQYLSNKNLKTKSKPLKEPVASAMKRDHSIIFTSVPEEDSEQGMERRSGSHQNRPKFLNLKTRMTDFAVEPLKPPDTPYYGQTSVCSTPMTELKKIVHSKPLSICVNETSKTEISATILPETVFASNFPNRKKSSSTLDVSSIDKSIINEYYDSNDKEKSKLTRSKTVVDPSYPIFRSDGSVVSHFFYKNNLESEMVEIIDEAEKKSQDSTLADFIKSFAPVEAKENVSENIEIPVVPPKRSQEHRKSLTLPLKSLTEGNETVGSPARRHSTSVLLTPLMSKLSSFDEKSSGFCSRDTTPSRVFTPTQQNFPFAFKKHKKHNDSDGDLQKCVLFVCGQQDMVVGLLLQEDGCLSADVITKLWEICTEHLGELEKQLRHCLETYPSGGQTNGEPYSYLYLDPEWDTVHRGGPWGTAELGALTYFHRDFKETPNITEILMRCCDGVIYGYQCAKSEVFYHQAANTNAGLPTPADPMGNVPLKARRRLERDHSIILL